MGTCHSDVILEEPPVLQPSIPISVGNWRVSQQVTFMASPCWLLEYLM